MSTDKTPEGYAAGYSDGYADRPKNPSSIKATGILNNLISTKPMETYHAGYEKGYDEGLRKRAEDNRRRD